MTTVETAEMIKVVRSTATCPGRRFGVPSGDPALLCADKHLVGCVLGTREVGGRLVSTNIEGGHCLVEGECPHL